jgi:L-seryl-tRNA(Ser) seleniumtransferase
MSLELTLKAYQNLDTLPLKIPTIRMITEDEEEVKIRSEKLSNKLKSLNSYKIETELIRTKSMIGGGAYPLDNLDSWGVKLILKDFSEKDLEEKLRNNEIPIIVRIIEGFVVIDCKALLEKDYDIITSALSRIIGESND